MAKTMKIEGMMCAHCSGRVEKALNDLPGVTATVNLEAGTATVNGDVADDVLTKAVTDAGYTVFGIEYADVKKLRMPSVYGKQKRPDGDIGPYGC